MFSNLFSEPGKSIKTYAKLFYIFLVFAIIICAVALWLLEVTTFSAAVGILLGGEGAAYISCLLLFAFGELVENVAETKRLNAQILNKLCETPSKKRYTNATQFTPPISPVPKSSEQESHPISNTSAEKPYKEVLNYALQFSTTEGIRNHIERRLKFCDDPHAINVYESILAQPDENLRSTIENYLKD